MKTETETPLLTATVADVIPRPAMRERWIIVGYWPAGGWWRASKLLTHEDAIGLARNWIEKGWVHVAIYELPAPKGENER